MEIFRFNNPINPTLLDQGELINGLKTIMWIERYRDVSDFAFTANAEKMVHKQLPVGTMISHTESTEVMVVENHEIREELGKETEVTITGRSFESFLENRVVGSNKAWPTTASAETEYILPAGLTWNQAVVLIKNHIDTSLVIDQKDAILNVKVITDVGGTGDSFEMSIPRGDLYSNLINILDIDNLGIKTIRPGVRSPLGFTDPNMAIVIHRGEDLSKEVAFSHATGEIQSADYLWSNKKFKNAALVTGRWIETVVKDASAGYDRRMMYVEASDIDGEYTIAPTGAERDLVLSYMQTRGLAALAAQNEIALVKTEPTRDSRIYKYREHYGVGDIITVDGEYNETTSMRISEYVEIEDETGESGYPTLSAVYNEES